MNLSKITRITITIFITLIFAVSLYFNYLYFRNYQENKKISGQLSEQNISSNANNPVITGTVNSIDTKKIQITNTEKTVDIVITENTKFTKTVFDPGAMDAKPADAKISDIKQNMIVDVNIVSTDNVMTAVKVNFVENNIITGTINDISGDKIVITEFSVMNQDPAKIYDIKLSADTQYFHVVKEVDMEANTSVYKDMKKIIFNDMKKDDHVVIVYSSEISGDLNQPAERVISVSEQNK